MAKYRLNIQARHSPTCHVLLKTLLTEAGFLPDTVRERLAMRFLYPRRTHTRHCGDASLTPDAYSLLAESLSHTDGLPAARNTLQKACRIHPAHPDLLDDLK